MTITLLKELKITLGAGQWQVSMPLKFNAQTLQLIAYIAWRREVRTRRGKLIEDIFGFGKADEEATPKKLGEAFNSAKKSIRAALREAAGKLNTEAGQEIIDPHLDLFALDNEEYWLSRLCCVPDLGTIEQQFRIIDAARGQHLLLLEVQDACIALLTAYQGDLLENLIESSIQGEPEWESHWLRDPYTRYRDYHLTALWCRAEFLRSQGEHSATEPDQQKSLFEEAARLYREYALHAIKSRFDSKMRRGEAEHGLRYAFRMYAQTGNTHEAGKTYQTFSELVAIQFPEWDWRMSKKTEEAWRLVQQQTRAFLSLPAATQECKSQNSVR